MSKVEQVAKMMAEAQTRQEIEDIFDEHCSQYNGHSELSRIARLLTDLLGEDFDQVLAEGLPSESSNKPPVPVHYGVYLLRMKARTFRRKTEVSKEQKQVKRRSENKAPNPVDFMRLYDFAANFLVNGDWKAKTIAVRLFTGRRAGEVLYRSNFSEYGEYAIKVSYLAKVPTEKQSSSVVIPTLIPAADVIELVKDLREEWQLALPQHRETYDKVLRESGRMAAGEAIKSHVQNPVNEFFNTSVSPLFPELSLDDEDSKAHNLRGIYGCVLYRLMGGHDNPQNSESFMQDALVHVSEATTSQYRKYALKNFEPLLELHPGIEAMFTEKIGWIEDSTEFATFAIDSLIDQISDEVLKGKVLSAMKSNDPEALGGFLGLMIEQGASAQKHVSTKQAKESEDTKDATRKGSTKSPGAQRIQAIVDAIIAVNQKGEELAATTPLIQEVHKRLYGKTPNLSTCRAVLNEKKEAVKQLPAHNRNIAADTMETLIQEVLAQHGEPL